MRTRRTTTQARAGRLALGIAAALAVSLAPMRGAQADTSVWEVSRGDSRLYLGGTIHALRQSDYPLPEEFGQAYAGADEIHFEVDMSEAMDPAFVDILLSIHSYGDGRSLKSVLSEDVHAELYAFAGKFGIPPSELDSIKPYPAVTALLMIELESFGFEQPQGVEAYFLEQVDRDGLPRGALETMEFQARLLAGIGEGNEDAMVADFLEQVETLESDMEETISAWREGDVARLDELMLAEAREKFPEDYEAMFARRNRNWAPQIMAMLEDADVEFVLVGVGHMPGKDGLLELLRQQGATVRPLALQQR